jgi:hypothetical protein
MHAMPVLDRLAKARKELLFLLGAVVVALFAWTAYLSATLPPEHVTRHWDLAWSGFDLFEAVAIAGTVLALVRRSSLLPLLSAVAGTALLCDVWFDLITAAPGSDLRWSLVEAVAAEVPLAALCFWISFDSRRALFSAAAASEAGPPPTARPGRSAEAPAPARRRGSEAPSAGRTSR